jgi:hypothetical protein
MRTKGTGLLTQVYGPRTTWPTSWPPLRGRAAPPETHTAPLTWQQESTASAGESGPVTPIELERFRDDPDSFGADPRLLGKRPGDLSEDIG